MKLSHTVLLFAYLLIIMLASAVVGLRKRIVSLEERVQQVEINLEHRR